MDILLTHGYFLAEDAAEQKIMKPYPPLGLLYLSAYLKNRGLKVDLFDSTFASLDQLKQHIELTRPPVVGIYVNLITRRNALKITEFCKTIGIRVVAGGPEPANYPDEYLSHGVDVVVAGEGEATLEELLPYVREMNREALKKIHGIFFLDERNELVAMPARAVIADLNTLTFPDREAIDLNVYLDCWQEHHGLRPVSLITARGCPYNCQWCSHSVFGHSHRRRSPENVADELVWINEKYRPDQVWYADDVFTMNHKWLARYARELETRGLYFPFEAISREDRLDEEVIKTLKRMGCYRLWVGAESGSQKILDKMDRRTNAKRMQKMINLLQKHGIQAGTFIMVGYVEEEWDDLSDTVKHLKAAMPDEVLTTLSYPIKGTPFYREVSRRIISRIPWAEGSDRDLSFQGRGTVRFYHHAQRWIKNEWQSHMAIHKKPFSPKRFVKCWLLAKKARIGMWLTRGEREMG